ncbi:MAG: MlaD family protein [Candidatus Dormibacteria bacterium]
MVTSAPPRRTLQPVTAERRRGVDPLWTGAITAVALIVVLLAVLISGVPGGPEIPGPWNQNMTLHVQLADSHALEPHASVEMSGVKVGEVQSVAMQGNVAVANLHLYQQYSTIHRDATVYLRPHGLFGPKYIDIAPGTRAAPVLRDGDTIGVSQTVEPVDLDAILQALQAPEQQNLQTALIELGQAAAGQGDDVNHLLASANSLTQVLDSPLRNLDKVAPQLSDMLVNNDSFNAALAQTPLDQIVANSEATFKAFADNAGHLNSLLVHANHTLSSLQTALNGNGQNLGNALAMLGAQQPTPSTFSVPGQPTPASLSVVQQLQDFSYLLGLFGDNLTGNDPGYHSADVRNGINGAITNVASALSGFDNSCQLALPGQPAPNHCPTATQLANQDHYLQVEVFNLIQGLPIPQAGSGPLCLPSPANQCINLPISQRSIAGSPMYAGDFSSGFGSIFGS